MARNIAFMELTALETETIKRFREAFPPGDATVDFYLALGYFRALGLADGRAHSLADYVSTSEAPEAG